MSQEAEWFFNWLRRDLERASKGRASQSQWNQRTFKGLTHGHSRPSQGSSRFVKRQVERVPRNKSTGNVDLYCSGRVSGEALRPKESVDRRGKWQDWEMRWYEEEIKTYSRLCVRDGRRVVKW